ncbi:MAG: SulP family inorganic anion transporter [Candidatus Promineifilaceae bacterium]
MNRLRVSRSIFLSDMLTGLIMAIISIPGSLGNGLLAGVNPVYGIYSTIVGTTVAAVFTSSVYMNVDSTSATAIATGEEVAGLSPADQLAYIVVLGLLVGIFQLIFGFLKLGFLTRFISNAVMTGFLTGIGFLTILGQVGDLTGYYSEATNKVIRAVDTAAHAGQIHLPSLIIGLLAMVIIFLGDRSRFKKYSYAIALVAVTVVATVLPASGIATVGDTTDVPRTFVSLHLPDLSLVVRLIPPALAIAIIVLVQGSGVSQSVPNPDGDFPDADGDFKGQGIANIATGFAGGIPVGGSLGGTAVIRQLGGKSRWANIFTGLFAALAILTIGPLIELIPLPGLAGLLVMVGISMVNVGRLQTVYFTGTGSVAVMLITLVATLILPIQYAVAIGVILHILLYVFASSEAVRIERLVRRPDGMLAEAPLPAELESEEVYMLYPVGSLFFAGAAELEENLPDPGEAQRSVVILTLRDRDEVGSTFINVIKRYTKELEESGNKFKLTGLNERVTEQLERTGVLDTLGKEDVYPATDVFGEATQQAEKDAWAWIGKEVAPGAAVETAVDGRGRPIAAVMVPVTPWQEGLEWYARAFADARRVEVPESDWAYLDVHGVHLEIVSADEKLPSGSAGPVVYWHADNFDGRLQELLDCGATLYRGPIETGDGLKMAQVQDPWGNVIGIRGRPSDPD